MGELRGHQWQPRELAAFCHEAGWRDVNLVRAVAVCLSESQGYDRAFNDNLTDAGELRSRDVGLFQINIDAAGVGSAAETSLYDPVTNVRRAHELFERRGFQPWYGYTLGWATFPEWWIWGHRGWVPTGRYLHRALRGVGNFHARELGILPPPAQLLDYYRVPPRPTEPPPLTGSGRDRCRRRSSARTRGGKMLV